VVTAQASVLPIAIGFGAALVLFALWVPWLVRESRRPFPVRASTTATAPRRDPEHPAVSTLVTCTRSLLVSILPRHTTPRPSDAATAWSRAYARPRRWQAGTTCTPRPGRVPTPSSRPGSGRADRRRATVSALARDER
jgi:hypothetical protein